MFCDSQQLRNLFFGEVFGHGGFQRGTGRSESSEPRVLARGRIDVWRKPRLRDAFQARGHSRNK